ncbi:MAG: 50S ribosomal protein L29 [Myxococcales bacterium]|nr:50S ribosomal protein L29 [Myxococcales bacterium]
MKLDEIRAMNDQQLAGAELNARQALFEARISKTMGELADTSRPRRLRKDVARILTEKKRRAEQAATETTAAGEEQ